MIKDLYYFKEIAIPNCRNGSKCELNEFVKVLEKNSVDKHTYKRMCEQKFLG